MTLEDALQESKLNDITVYLLSDAPVPFTEEVQHICTGFFNWKDGKIDSLDGDYYDLDTLVKSYSVGEYTEPDGEVKKFLDVLLDDTWGVFRDKDWDLTF